MLVVLRSLGLMTFLMAWFLQPVWSQQVSVSDLSAGERLPHMIELQVALETKLTARIELRESLATAAADDVPVIENSIVELNIEIAEIQASFEQLAIGSADASLFHDDESGSVDWRDEVVQIMMPFMQNLKRITEKPRRIEQLRSTVTRVTEQQRVSALALSSIQQVTEKAGDDSTKDALVDLASVWTERNNDLQREINLAEVQLENLQRNDVPLWMRVRGGLISFITGRGLTILLAILAATGTWFFLGLIEKLFSKRAVGEEVKTFRTRKRIVHYALKAVTALIMLIAVMIVFYVRGDVLLMGFTFLIGAAATVGLRHTLPRFLAEMRLLLNIGSIREGERVVYQGLPLKVAALNMQSVLVNPELTGTIRLPLQEMLGLVSRPVGKESWFPASKNNYILMDDGKVVKVQSLTLEHVVLEHVGGASSTIPTAEFFNMSFENLSSGETFAVTSTFGIGYSHQQDSLDLIPLKLQQAIKAALSETEIGIYTDSVSVELQEAGSSSLDYWLSVKMQSGAAGSYQKIKRLIQQVCVNTCTQERWDIPFPQLTLHNP